MAAVAARKEHGYAGWAKRQRTAGMFWRFTDSDGKSKPLNQLRSDETG